MRISKKITGVAAGIAVVAAGLVVTPSMAFASDEDPLLPGSIYWFDAVGPLADQTPATQLFGGANATSGGNLSTDTGRTWQTMTTENPCPAGSVSLAPYIRIPQTGMPENDWPQVAMGAVATAKDADGRYYSTTAIQSDRIAKSEVISYLSTQPGNTGTFPFLGVCRLSNGLSNGYFRNLVTITGTAAANLTWTIDSTAIAADLTDTTTALAVSDASIELGDTVTLTATVAPAAATGNVEFFVGAASLGTDAVDAGVATIDTAALPVGTQSVTAVYAGDAAHDPSTSAAVEVVVAPVAPRSTTATLAVTPVDGPAYSPVTMTVTVVAATGTPAGSVRFLDGATVLATVPVDAAGVAVFTSNTMAAGAHSLTAEFVGTAPYTDSAAAAVTATFALAGAVHVQDVTVEIPVGTITITTPYTPAAPLALGVATLDPADSTYSASAPFEDIVITDSRTGDLGFTASVVSGPFESATDSFPGVHAGLTGLVATQVAGNALQASNVVLTPRVPFTDGLDVPKVFAQYAAGQSIGTAHIDGVFGVDQVPTSVAPGLYTATVTLTAV